jgi:hypothetical protein
MTLDQGYDQGQGTSLGPVKQFCEILFQLMNSVKSYGSDNVNKHSESIASNTKSPTGGIFNQNSSSRTKLNFDF